ncbi:MAG TPA: hypothetical protein VJU77_01575 [Chthoniobacterales bacterium]|nr:hypothetical protein [Chthoniobacterales bacterium]
MVQDANKLVVFGSQLVGVIIVIIGLWTQQSKLQTPRPAGSKATAVAGDDRYGDRFARLWDDPLGDVSKIAVLKPRVAVPKPVAAEAEPTNVAPTTSESGSPTPTPTRPKVTKLLVWNILDARQTAEVKERRLRIRYAIVSAILTADYLPARESLLSPLADESAPASAKQKGKDDVIGYFETFRAAPESKAPHQRVILVWTPKEIKLDADRVEKVKQQIEERDGEEAEGEVELRVLHHGNSQDLEDYASSPNPYLEGKISFVRATIGNKKLDKYRSIVTDDDLIGTLFNELSLRIPALNTVMPNEKNRPRIVVVTERDTTYSQAIIKEIKDRFGPVAELEFCSYLRGLDGRSENASLPGDSPRAEKQETSSDKSKDEGYGETSFGRSQLDYLRRLAFRLGTQTNSRKGHAVAAVGILGSDIYDKILVLEALQPQLPAAIFFTTDLDALYLEHAHQDYTRNLVVAAADDLVVNSSLPPMRDSYQTILVRTVQGFINASEPRTAPTPHIFEIARGKHVDLKAGSPESAHTKLRDAVLAALAHGWSTAIIFFLSLAHAFVILIAIFSRTPKQDPDQPNITIAPMKPWARILVWSEISLGLAGILVLLIFLGWRDNTLLFAEPLALGISIWPSVLIRLLAFIVAILFLLLASYSFFTEGTAIKDQMEEALGKRIQKIQFHLPEGFAREGIRLCRSFAYERPTTPPLQEFECQLDRFFGKEEPIWWRNERLWQIIGISVAYFLLSAFLFRQWPPSVPGRGAFALLNEKIILALGVSLYIIHLVFCLHLHGTAFYFLRTLRAICERESWRRIERTGTRIKAKHMLEATSTFTAVIGKTLLYPLTVLILIILSRLRQFDNWTMTPSLAITFLAGASALITASLLLWVQGTRLKNEVLDRFAEDAERYASEFPDELPAKQTPSSAQPGQSPPTPVKDESEARKSKVDACEKARKELDAINQGVFAPWYNQPIFVALFSVVGVFGSLSVAAVARLFVQ